MPVPAYRQPWFWAVIVAVAAILGFVIVTAASNPERNAGDSTTIVQQPSAAPEPQAVPVPVTPSTPSSPSTVTPPPAEPVRPERPVAPAKPAPAPKPTVIKEKTVIIREGHPSTAPVPPGPQATPAPTPAPAPGTFLDTGMPKDLTFNDSTFRAQDTTTMTQDQLKSIGTAADGTELFVSANATEPYQSVLAVVPGETDKYVRYQVKP